MKLTHDYTEKSISQSSFFDYKTPRAHSPSRSPRLLSRTSKKPDIPIILAWFLIQSRDKKNLKAVIYETIKSK